MTRLLAPAVCVAALLALPLTADAASAHHDAAQAGSTSATLSWLKTGRYQYGAIRLSIVRGGTAVVDHVRIRDRYVQPLDVKVADLDGDGEPEVIVDLYTGGAHCCEYSRVYRYDAGTGTYTYVRHLWGDPGYRLEDLDGDGRPEFVTADDSFAYRFTDYAASGLPIQILSYSGGAFADVTRAYPAQVSDDAAQWLRAYDSARRRHGPKDLKGVVAAYVADVYLLGDGATAEAFLTTAQQGGDLGGFGGSAARFVLRLHRFLGARGYLA
jgi:hypothetical protein